MPALILTIGHSTRTLEEFIQLLQAERAALLADIRTVPRSRMNPHFNRDSLPRELERQRIRYVHVPGLGGRRQPRKDSRNTGWKNAGFRGYADYMQTEEFRKALDGLITIASAQLTCIMCAEAVPWRCHRSLVADALLARGITVEHITGLRKRRPHIMTRFALTEGDRVTYPADPAQIRLEGM